MRGTRSFLVALVLVAAACTSATSSSPSTSSAPSTTTSLVPGTTTTSEPPDIGHEGPFTLSWSKIEGNFDAGAIEAITTTGDGFAAVGVAFDGAQPRLWQSRDGEEWNSFDIDLPGYAADHELMDLEAGGAGYVLIGTTDPGVYPTMDLAWISTDGRTWQRIGAEILGVEDDARPFRKQAVRINQAAVSSSGALLVGDVGSSLDAAAIVDRFFPDAAADEVYEVGYGGDDTSVTIGVADGDSLGRISLDELGYGGIWIEEVLEEGGRSSLWYSSDLEAWIDTHPKRDAPLHLGQVIAVGDSILIGAEDMSGYGPQGPRAFIWRTLDGRTWERLPRESGDVTFHSWALLDDGIALTETLGFINSAPVPHFLVMDSEGVWNDNPPPWDPPGTWYGMPGLSGGELGVIATHGSEPSSCNTTDCQFRPDEFLMLSVDGEQWSAPQAASDIFGLNSIVLDVAVGRESVLAFVADGSTPGPDSRSLWLGTPIPMDPVDEYGIPAVENSLTISPWHGSSVTTESTVDIWVRLQDHSGFEIDRVRVNGADVIESQGEWAGTFSLEVGRNEFIVEVDGPGFSHVKTIIVRSIPDADKLEGNVITLTQDTVGFDVGTRNDDEFSTFEDPDPGVVVEFPIAEVVDVNLWCDLRGVPYEWFVDQFNTDRGIWEWMPFELTLVNGEVVQFHEQCWG